MDKRQELTAELRKARGWILAVGLLMVTVDLLTAYVLHDRDWPSEAKLLVAKYDAVILAFFLGMWLLARFKPVAACVLALVGFWALHLYVATLDPASLFHGILMKVLFTLALIRGIKSANRAEQLQRELAEVFG